MLEKTFYPNLEPIYIYTVYMYSFQKANSDSSWIIHKQCTSNNWCAENEFAPLQNNKQAMHHVGQICAVDSNFPIFAIKILSETWCSILLFVLYKKASAHLDKLLTNKYLTFKWNIFKVLIFHINASILGHLFRYKDKKSCWHHNRWSPPFPTPSTDLQKRRQRRWPGLCVSR